MLYFRFLTILFATLLFSMFAVFAQANSIGFSYSRAVDDVSVGIHGDYEKSLGNIDVELEGQLQSGNIYVGNLDLSATFIKYVKVSSNNNLKGYELDSLGRENVLSLSAVVPFLENYEVSIGVFGRNGNPFSPAYELSDASNPLSEIIEKNAGITMSEGSNWGVSVEAGFDVSMFEVDIQLLLDPENVRHQGILNIGTGGKLFNNFGWNANLDIISQSIDEEDSESVLEFETSTIIGVNYRF